MQRHNDCPDARLWHALECYYVLLVVYERLPAEGATAAVVDVNAHVPAERLNRSQLHSFHITMQIVWKPVVLLRLRIRSDICSGI